MMFPSMDSNPQQIEAGGRSAVVDTVPYVHLTSPKYYMQCVNYNGQAATTSIQSIKQEDDYIALALPVGNTTLQ